MNGQVVFSVVEGQTIEWSLRLDLPGDSCVLSGGAGSVTAPDGTVLQVVGDPTGFCIGQLIPGVTDVFDSAFDLVPPQVLAYVASQADLNDEDELEGCADFGGTNDFPDQLDGTACTQGGPNQSVSASGCTSLMLVIPEIMIEKTANIDAICEGVDTEVTYTYFVTNLTEGSWTGDPDGTVGFINVQLDDDTCDNIIFIGGDDDGDGVLDPGEVWIYECTTTINTATTNTVVVTAQDDVAGLTYTDDDFYDIGANPVPGVDVEPDQAEICEGDDPVAFCATVTGGTAPYDVQWYFDGAPIGDPCLGLPEGGECCIDVGAGLGPGTYEFCAMAVDANGCEAEACGQLIVNPNPTAEVTIDVGDICFGDETEVCVVPAGGTPPYTVQIYRDGDLLETCFDVPAGGECCLTVGSDLPVGAYEFCGVVTDSAGCEGEDCETLEVHPLKVVTIVGPMDPICVGFDTELCATISGGTPPYDVQWYFNGNPFGDPCIGIGDGDQCCIIASDPGEYCAVAVDVFGCEGEDCFTLNVAPEPTVICTPLNPEICEGESQTICATVSDGSAPYTVQWYLDGAPFGDPCVDIPEGGQCCITVDQPGEYCAVAIDAFGCEGMCCTMLIVNPNPTVMVNDACIGGDLCATPMGGSPPYTYAWSTGESTPCITPAAPGEYCVTVTDANGCEGEACGTVFEGLDVSVNDACLGDEICATVIGGTPPLTYMWNTGATTDCITPTMPGEYCVMVVDANGCEGEACGMVFALPDCFIDPDPGTCVPGGVPIDFCGPAGMMSYAWMITGDGMIDGPADGQCVTVIPSMGGAQFCLTLTIVDMNGCTSTCELCVCIEPPPGNEGCTPGYWKQPHHFSDWAEGYDPDDLFSETCYMGVCFEDAYPGKTLLEVLSTGGGGCIALGRHTVAALLNALNDNVAYGFAPLQVIEMFNAVNPGSQQSCNALKNEFEMANEQGCPLNGHSDFNGDGLVGIDDLMVIITNWGTPGPGDLDGNGVVDTGDLLQVLANWGS